ncbi:farnesol dehydrogenase-like [Adelges cooleyi]|uniref:farnesol dehydrogenase-like n=1 Tax=Adelges cooleyi TaxID=133065 RepID=UPI00217FEF34|nr:farnesol dehydrogenase-like [Adelges cooleyi]
MDRWQGSVALVTGASAGIGKSIAIELARHGMVVVGWARRLDKLKTIEDELSTEGKTFVGRQCDVADETAVLNEFSWIEKTYGKLNVVINNAGIGAVAYLADGKTELWQKVFNVNLISVAVITREAVKFMRKFKIDDGHLIFMSSIVGHMITPLIGSGIYCATKHGVTLMAEATRQELNASGSKIRVSSVSPSFTKSEIFERSGRKITDDMPYLECKDIAEIVAWILSASPSVQISDVIIRPTGSEY